jgi:hypothetical protein
MVSLEDEIKNVESVKKVTKHLKRKSPRKHEVTDKDSDTIMDHDI